MGQPVFAPDVARMREIFCALKELPILFLKDLKYIFDVAIW